MLMCSFYNQLLLFMKVDGINSNNASRLLQSAFSGSGDRADPSKWEKIEGPVKVVLSFCVLD